MRGTITLITDFGLEDGHVGAMKGVICSCDLVEKILVSGYNCYRQYATVAPLRCYL
jgi:S-adenosylmethionine hydrolase